ncbi:MAG TPA: hypothetical protein VHE81_02855 [Lacipirellulaceae bacterium]|nr:hypothetical protein [Lacipirellulaceae bacterium]
MSRKKKRPLRPRTLRMKRAGRLQSKTIPKGLDNSERVTTVLLTEASSTAECWVPIAGGAGGERPHGFQLGLVKSTVVTHLELTQTGRQDARHVAILAQVLPAYLEDLQKAAIEGRMEERKLIEFLERLLTVVTAEKARKVLKELQLDARGFFVGLGHEKLLRLRAFIDKRVPRKLH